MNKTSHFTFEAKVPLAKPLKNCIDSLCKNSSSKLNLEENLDLMVVILQDNFGILTKHKANTFLTKITTKLHIARDDSKIFQEKGGEIVLFFDFMDFIEKFRNLSPDMDFNLWYSPTQNKLKITYSNFRH
jgi:hypothetical protein